MLQLPVTILTGFLGAGKTTLLNRILTESHGKKYAVIVNEFSELGIDDQLVVEADEEIFAMNNGCICCTVRGDLIRILSGLMRRGRDFDGILVETTGLADPAPVAQTFFVDPEVKEVAKLDAIVTLVDARHFPDHVKDGHEAVEQVAFADVLLLNKIDLVSPETLDAIEEQLRKLNPFAPLHRTKEAGIDLGLILNRGAFDLQRILEQAPHFLHSHPHSHEDRVRSVGISTHEPIDPEKFESWIGALLLLKGQDIFRSKGILNVAGANRRFVFQGVHMQMNHSWGAPWRGRDTRESRIVFIGRDLDEASLREGVLACTQPLKQPLSS